MSSSIITPSPPFLSPPSQALPPPPIKHSEESSPISISTQGDPIESQIEKLAEQKDIPWGEKICRGFALLGLVNENFVFNDEIEQLPFSDLSPSTLEKLHQLMDTQLVGIERPHSYADKIGIPNGFFLRYVKKARETFYTPINSIKLVGSEVPRKLGWEWLKEHLKKLAHKSPALQKLIDDAPAPTESPNLSDIDMFFDACGATLLAPPSDTNISEEAPFSPLESIEAKEEASAEDPSLPPKMKYATREAFLYQWLNTLEFEIFYGDGSDFQTSFQSLIFYLKDPANSHKKISSIHVIGGKVPSVIGTILHTTSLEEFLEKIPNEILNNKSIDYQAEQKIMQLACDFIFCKPYKEMLKLVKNEVFPVAHKTTKGRTSYHLACEGKDKRIYEVTYFESIGSADKRVLSQDQKIELKPLISGNGTQGVSYKGSHSGILHYFCEMLLFDPNAVNDFTKWAFYWWRISKAQQLVDPSTYNEGELNKKILKYCSKISPKVNPDTKEETNPRAEGVSNVLKYWLEKCLKKGDPAAAFCFVFNPLANLPEGFSSKDVKDIWKLLAEKCQPKDDPKLESIASPLLNGILDHKTVYSLLHVLAFKYLTSPDEARDKMHLKALLPMHGKQRMVRLVIDGHAFLFPADLSDSYKHFSKVYATLCQKSTHSDTEALNALHNIMNTLCPAASYSVDTQATIFQYKNEVHFNALEVSKQAAANLEQEVPELIKHGYSQLLQCLPWKLSEAAWIDCLYFLPKILAHESLPDNRRHIVKAIKAHLSMYEDSILPAKEKKFIDYLDSLVNPPPLDLKAYIEALFSSHQKNLLETAYKLCPLLAEGNAGPVIDPVIRLAESCNLKVAFSYACGLIKKPASSGANWMKRIESLGIALSKSSEANISQYCYGWIDLILLQKQNGLTDQNAKELFNGCMNKLLDPEGNPKLQTALYLASAAMEKFGDIDYLEPLSRYAEEFYLKKHPKADEVSKILLDHSKSLKIHGELDLLLAEKKLEDQINQACQSCTLNTFKTIFEKYISLISFEKPVQVEALRTLVAVWLPRLCNPEEDKPRLNEAKSIFENYRLKLLFPNRDDYFTLCTKCAKHHFNQYLARGLDADDSQIMISKLLKEAEGPAEIVSAVNALISFLESADADKSLNLLRRTLETKLDTFINTLFDQKQDDILLAFFKLLPKFKIILQQITKNSDILLQLFLRITSKNLESGDLSPFCENPACQDNADILLAICKSVHTPEDIPQLKTAVENAIPKLLEDTSNYEPLLTALDLLSLTKYTKKELWASVMAKVASSPNIDIKKKAWEILKNLGILSSHSQYDKLETHAIQLLLQLYKASRNSSPIEELISIYNNMAADEQITDLRLYTYLHSVLNGIMPMYTELASQQALIRTLIQARKKLYCFFKTHIAQKERRCFDETLLTVTSYANTADEFLTVCGQFSDFIKEINPTEFSPEIHSLQVILAHQAVKFSGSPAITNLTLELAKYHFDNFRDLIDPLKLIQALLLNHNEQVIGMALQLVEFRLQHPAYMQATETLSASSLLVKTYEILIDRLLDFRHNTVFLSKASSLIEKLGKSVPFKKLTLETLKSKWSKACMYQLFMTSSGVAAIADRVSNFLILFEREYFIANEKTPFPMQTLNKVMYRDSWKPFALYLEKQCNDSDHIISTKTIIEVVLMTRFEYLIITQTLLDEFNINTLIRRIEEITLEISQRCTQSFLELPKPLESDFTACSNVIAFLLTLEPQTETLRYFLLCYTWFRLMKLAVMHRDQHNAVAELIEQFAFNTSFKYPKTALAHRFLTEMLITIPAGRKILEHHPRKRLKILFFHQISAPTYPSPQEVKEVFADVVKLQLKRGFILRGAHLLDELADYFIEKSPKFFFEHCRKIFSSIEEFHSDPIKKRDSVQEIVPRMKQIIQRFPSKMHTERYKVWEEYFMLCLNCLSNSPLSQKHGNSWWLLLKDCFEWITIPSKWKEDKNSDYIAAQDALVHHTVVWHESVLNEAAPHPHDSEEYDQAISNNLLFMQILNQYQGPGRGYNWQKTFFQIWTKTWDFMEAKLQQTRNNNQTSPLFSPFTALVLKLAAQSLQWNACAHRYCDFIDRIERWLPFFADNLKIGNDTQKIYISLNVFEILTSGMHNTKPSDITDHEARERVFMAWFELLHKLNDPVLDVILNDTYHDESLFLNSFINPELFKLRLSPFKPRPVTMASRFKVFISTPPKTTKP